MFEPYDEQLIVIHSTADRILLNAGPGNGKTTVLSCNAIKHSLELIQSKVPWADKDAKVLLVSLTNYVADNAKLSIEQLVRDNLVVSEIGVIKDEQAVVDRILYCTIHSFAFQQLLRHSRVNGLNGFTVGNDYGEEILDDILKDIKPAWWDDMSIRKDLLEINALYARDAQEVSDVIKTEFPQYARHTKIFIEILRSLEQKKREGNIITYDDMVHRFFKLLNNWKIREQIFRKYPVIIVDEFQDTGSLQWKVIKKMVGPKSKLLCAGDDGQTIFTWAGASFERFKHFKTHYPDCELGTLTINRRSTKQIVALSNALMAQSVFATKKHLTAESDGRKVSITNCPDRQMRYQYIKNQINRLVKESVPYEEIAIIYRFYRDLLDFKEFLSESGIPYQIFRDKSKRDRPIIKVVFALIKIIEASAFQKAEWRTVLMFLEGVGKQRVDQIINWLETKKPEETIYPQPYRFVKHLQHLLIFVNAWKNSTGSNPDRLSDIMDYVRILPKVNSSIKDHIRPTLLKLAHECNSLSDIINKYSDRSYPLCYPSKDELPYPDSYVKLSTIHGIKGGGFHTVFYLGTDDHLYEKYGLFRSKKKKEGELQLMNVAITRARRELHLLFPIDMETWRNNEEASNPWRFVRKAYNDL